MVILEKGKQKLQVRSSSCLSFEDAQKLIIHIAQMYCDGKVQDSELKYTRDALTPKEITDPKTLKRPAAPAAERCSPAPAATAATAAASEDPKEYDIEEKPQND